MNAKFKFIFALVFLTSFIIFTAAYVVNYDEHVVVTQFGKIIRSVSEPGLYFKTPIITELRRYTKKLIEFDADPVSVPTLDKKTIIFDTIAMYRISDPVLFFQRVGTLSAAEKRIDDVVYSAVRNIAGRMTFEDIIHSRRIEATDSANEMAANQAAEYGIKILRTKFKKVLLPVQNEESIFKSMIDERMTIAAQLRAEGNSRATEIVSTADTTRVKRLASANEQAAMTKAEGDKAAQEAIAKAVETTPELYMLMKNLEIYRSAIGKSVIVIDPTKGIFKNLVMPLVEERNPTPKPGIIENVQPQEVSSPVEEQIEVQIEEQIEEQVEEQIEVQVEEQVVEQIEVQVEKQPEVRVEERTEESTGGRRPLFRWE